MPPSSERFVVPIGPQHPALKEPGHFEFTVDGEVVTGATVRLGFVHRGLEKAAESRNWVQDLYLLERVCGICSHCHATAFSIGVERLAGVEAPPRAQAIRVLMAELERIHSHLLWLGVGAHEAGFESLFMFSWRDRETVMDVLEQLSGNRVNYSANVLGGVKFDIGSEQADLILKALEFLEGRIQHYLEIVTTDTSFLRRTHGIAITTFDQASQLGLVGPTARASGLAVDVRVDSPYGGYPHYPANLITNQAGDLEARFVIRLQELQESCRLIRAVLADLPPGELTVRMPRKIKAGETVSRLEAPRGELFYFIKSNGGEIPDRIHIRTPTICNLASVLTLAVGHNLADVPMILAGIDPCFSCNDRVISLVSPHDTQLCTWDQLRQHGLDYYNLQFPTLA